MRRPIRSCGHARHTRSRARRCRNTRPDAREDDIRRRAEGDAMTSAIETADPLFAGLFDRKITDVPATAQNQRYMTSVAPPAANQGKWVEQPRLPIPVGEM